MAAAMDSAGILVGLFGVLYAVAVVLASREVAEPGAPRRFWPFDSSFVLLGVAMGGLIVLPFLVSLLSRPPFAPGARLGIGFLLGGAWASVAALIMPWTKALLPHLPPPRQWVAGIALSGGFSAWTLAGANVTLLSFKDYPTDGLMGFGIGFCMVAILARSAGDMVSITGGGVAGWEGLGPQAVLAAGLVAACSLGVHHFPRSHERMWWSLPLATTGAGSSLDRRWP